MTRGTLLRLVACRRAASAAEFALVLPLLILFIFALIDGGRWMWELNQQEKAVQAAARIAVVSRPVASGLADYEFAIDPGTPVTQGEPVPTSYFTSAVCTSSACTCTGSECGSMSLSHDARAYAALRNVIGYYYKGIANPTMTVRYDNVGLGFAGDPNGSDVAPLVTVSLTGLTFTPLFYQLFGVGSVPMPNQSAALTGEDLSCAPLSDNPSQDIGPCFAASN